MRQTQTDTKQVYRVRIEGRSYPGAENRVMYIGPYHSAATIKPIYERAVRQYSRSQLVTIQVANLNWKDAALKE